MTAPLCHCERPKGAWQSHKREFTFYLPLIKSGIGNGALSVFGNRDGIFNGKSVFFGMLLALGEDLPISIKMLNNCYHDILVLMVRKSNFVDILIGI